MHFFYREIHEEKIAYSFIGFVIYSYGLAHVGRVGSVFLTLSVTIERYYSVCHPLRPFGAKRLLLPSAVIFTLVYNVPKFFEFKLGSIESTWLRRDAWYAFVYVFASKFVLIELAPYVVLVVLNYLIWRRVKRLVDMRTECGIDSGEFTDTYCACLN